jgi:hypothetical protein
MEIISRGAQVKEWKAINWSYGQDSDTWATIGKTTWT